MRLLFSEADFLSRIFRIPKYPHLRHALLVQGEGGRRGRDRDGRGTLMFMRMSPSLWSTHTLTTNMLFKTQVVEEEKVRRNCDRQHEIPPSQQPRSCCFDCAFQTSKENWHWCKRLHLFSLYDVSIFICLCIKTSSLRSFLSGMGGCGVCHRELFFLAGTRAT